MDSQLKRIPGAFEELDFAHRSLHNAPNNQREGTYRLPVEAEWEYATRAGSNTAFGLGEITVLYCDHDPTLDNMGWYCGNSDRHTHPVAHKARNAGGLYDIHGHVYEWCQDWYGKYPPTPLTDPGSRPLSFPHPRLAQKKI